MANLAIVNSNYSTNSLSSSLESRPLKTLASLTKIALNALGGLATVLAAKTLIGLSLIGSVVIIKIITTTFLAATITLFPPLPILALAVATIAAAVATSIFASLNFTISLNIFAAVILCLDSLSENISKEKFFIEHGDYPLPPPAFCWPTGEIPDLRVNASLDGAPSREITLNDLETWKTENPRIPFLVEWTPTQQDFPLVIPFLKIYGNQIKKLDLSHITFFPWLLTFLPELEGTLVSLKNLKSLSLPSFKGNFSENFMDFLSKIKDLKCHDSQSYLVKLKLLFSTAKHQNIPYNKDNRIEDFSLNAHLVNLLDPLHKKSAVHYFSDAIEKIKDEEVLKLLLAIFISFPQITDFQIYFLDKINKLPEINERSIAKTCKEIIPYLIDNKHIEPTDAKKDVFDLISDSLPLEYDIKNSLERIVENEIALSLFDIFLDVEKKEGPLFDFFTSEQGKAFLSKHQYTTFLSYQNIQYFIHTNFANDPWFYQTNYLEDPKTLVVSCHYDFPEKYPKKALKLYLEAHKNSAILSIKYRNQEGVGEGVTRDFLTRMYEAIAKEYSKWNKENLRNIGRAWKCIYMDPQQTRTGVVFDSLFSEKLLSLSMDDIENDFNLNKLETIEILLRLIPKNYYFYEYLKKLKKLMEIDPENPADDDGAAYKAIGEIYESITEDPLDIPKTPEEHLKFIEKFTADILTVVTNPLRNLLEIARGFAEGSNEEEWNNIKTMSAEELSTIIQGEFSRETFINSIFFRGNPQELHNEIKRWIIEWVNQRNDAQVKRLLFYITGSTVCSQIHINIIGKDTHPTTHTCYRIMYLPNNIKKKSLMKQFDEWVSDKKCHMHII